MEDIETRQKFAGVAEQLEEIKELVAATHAEAKATNGRVNELETTVYGDTDERRRVAHPGLEQQLGNISARLASIERQNADVIAVGRSLKWVVGSGVLSLIVTIVTVILRTT